MSNQKSDDKVSAAPEDWPNLTKSGAFARDKELASRAGKLGAQAAAKVKREKRTIKAALRDLMDESADKIPGLKEAAKALREAGVEDPTGADAVAYMQVAKAGRGDTEAARFVRDSVGEKPSVDLSVSAADRVVDADTVAELSDEELIALAEAHQDQLPAPSRGVLADGAAPDVAPDGD